MPSETCPYVFRAAIPKPPGSTAPGSATTTASPTSKLWAPQTMPRGSGSPTSTAHQRIAFPFECSSTSYERTTPTTSGPVTSAPAASTVSTSSPARINPSARRRPVTSSGSAAYSRSQLSGALIGPLHAGTG